MQEPVDAAENFSTSLSAFWLRNYSRPSVHLCHIGILLDYVHLRDLERGVASAGEVQVHVPVVLSISQRNVM